jgi:hypothetical protein
MSITPWVWPELRDLFETDDGSLPEIRVDYSNSAATVDGYAELRAWATRVGTDSPQFWPRTRDAACAVDSAPNAAALVVSGEVDAFHIVLGGLQVGGITILDLGVFVFPSRLALDARVLAARRVTSRFSFTSSLVWLGLGERTACAGGHGEVEVASTSDLRMTAMFELHRGSNTDSRAVQSPRSSRERDVEARRRANSSMRIESRSRYFAKHGIAGVGIAMTRRVSKIDACVEPT